MRTRRLLAATTTAVVLLAIPQGTAAGVDDGCPATTPTIVGTSGDDELVGTSGDDVILALAGDDTVRGGGGHDVVCGGPGTDRLVGGDGDDELYGGSNGLQQPYEDNPPDNVGDTLVPGAGDDHVDPGHDTETDAGGGFLPDEVSFARSASPVSVDLAMGTATGEGTDTVVVEGRLAVVGSPYDDVLLGSEHADGLRGGAGADLLRGLSGDDSLQADPRSYRLDRPGWDDAAYGGAGNDSLDLGNGDDLGRGGPGRDSLIDLAGAADLRGGPGRDWLDAHLQHADGQQLVGGPGHDTLYAWAVLDPAGERLRASGRIDLAHKVMRIVVGEERRHAVLGGVEVLRVPDGVWRVIGTDRAERVHGAETGWSRIMVRAGGGDDQISGTPGDDRIDGGPGTDRSGDDQGRDVCTSIERWYAGQRCDVVR